MLLLFGVAPLRSLRGTCEGYLKAFDKHMNLLMTDVKEVYTVPTSGAKSSQQVPKKTMTRFLKQLLVRGDNIVLICAAAQAQVTSSEVGREASTT
jgi:small nuclear ribonucleoprotein (snRNP)-like protein